jgi:hypothetical protein
MELVIGFVTFCVSLARKKIVPPHRDMRVEDG